MIQKFKINNDDNLRIKNNGNGKVLLIKKIIALNKTTALLQDVRSASS